MEPRHLPNAPIREALVDLQVTLPQEATIELLDTCHEQLNTKYPIRKSVKIGTFGVNWEDDQPPKTSVDHSVLGYRYESEDHANVLQIRTNGFTFSRIENYTTWEDMIREARELWEIYADATSPQQITRVATRYINVMRLPLPINDFQNYLTAPPQVPENLPQGISSFLTRIVLPEPHINAVGIITQALESIEPEAVPVVLDIDTFVTRPFDVENNEYWNCLDQLREFKNRIFFGSVTEEAGGLFG